jgi:hypothetical protein
MPVRTANDLASAVKLFRAYASSLEIDLSYQDFEAEMEAMPGKDLIRNNRIKMVLVASERWCSSSRPGRYGAGC